MYVTNRANCFRLRLNITRHLKLLIIVFAWLSLTVTESLLDSTEEKYVLKKWSWLAIIGLYSTPVTHFCNKKSSWSIFMRPTCTSARLIRCLMDYTWRLLISRICTTVMQLEKAQSYRRAVPARRQQQHTSLATCNRDIFHNRLTLTFDFPTLFS